MADLKLYKVNSLPLVVEASALYFVKGQNNRFSIYLTDKTGQITYRSPDSTDISDIVIAVINALKGQPDGLASLDDNGDLAQVVNTALGIDGQDGILKSNNDYVWGFIDEFLYASGTSASDPSRITLFNSIQGLRFRSNRLIQVWADFQIPYDIALNTIVYPILHWMPTTNDSGICRWGFEYSVCKGHGQQTFPATTTVYLNDAIASNTQWLNKASEFTAIPSTNIEPGSTIKMRIFRDGANSADTYNSDTTAWKISLKYQKARIGTRTRTPPFYT